MNVKRKKQILQYMNNFKTPYLGCILFDLKCLRFTHDDHILSYDFVFELIKEGLIVENGLIDFRGGRVLSYIKKIS